MTSKINLSVASVLSACIDVIRTFNPVTHSIDTHCSDKLGDVFSQTASPKNVLIQQIVYGCFKEKPLLQAFIDTFYSDNAARVLRVDMTLYTILAYLAVFRLDELGVGKFREICADQEPTKVSTFIDYVFNKENMWNSIRAAWMKVVDLAYIEQKLIPRLESRVPEMRKYAVELDRDAVSNAAAQAAKEEARARGEAGLAKVPRKPVTCPVSPRLTKTRPPMLPEPERIEAHIEAKPVPAFIHKTTLADLQRSRDAAAEKVKQSTQAKYSKKLEYRFHESKAGRSLEEVRREVEEQRTKDLAFDASFHNPPPDFQHSAPAVRLNAAAVLKEDALFRKQQAKDAEVLRNYEEELRDPFEFYMWQKELRERDHADKLKGVALRREQAKQSAVEAREAILRQKADNYTVANLMREQAEVIKAQKELERQLEVLQHQETVQGIMAERSTKPQQAVRRALEERIEAGRRIREQLEAARAAKEEQDRREEETKADTIRQLRALNTVHKEHIAVFDPTQTAGIGLLDEMSYMEMQVRQRQERERAEEQERQKREQIAEEKQKKAAQLDKRVDVIMRAREVKAQANQQARQRAKEAKEREEAALKEARAAAAAQLERELSAKREAHRAEQAALKAEQDRVRRQQQYLGAAMGQVEAVRDQQLQLARERQAVALEREARLRAEAQVQTQASDRLNKQVIERAERRAKLAAVQERDRQVAEEKKVSIEKIKGRIVEKKSMFLSGQRQHEATKTVLVEHNPYAESISQESLCKARSLRLSTSAGATTAQGGNNKRAQLACN